MSDLQRILDNAPKGATHYADNTYFRKRAEFPVGRWFEYTDESKGFEVTQASNIPEVSRLSDIAKIVEQHNLLYKFNDNEQKVVLGAIDDLHELIEE